MAKPEKIKVPSKDFFAWEYEEQTRIKHKVLQEYFRIYASKLGSRGNTLFFDCHGGCGAYIDTDGSLYYGSSILVYKVAQSVYEKRLYTNNQIIICERNIEYFENLKRVLNDAGINNKSINKVRDRQRCPRRHAILQTDRADRTIDSQTTQFSQSIHGKKALFTRAFLLI